MATRSQARLFAQLLARYEPEVRRAFMASVVDLQSNVDWPELLRALERSDVAGAVASLNIDPAAWTEYSMRMTEVYAAAGASTAAQIRATDIGGVGTRFNLQNPRAEDWIRRNVAENIRQLSEEAREVARATIEIGYAAGRHPRSIALDLVGRVSGPSGRRSGGVLGLDSPRAERLVRVSEGMRTAEGVRDLVVKHSDGRLSVRYKVNESTAQRILAAYRAGSAVPERQRDISERQYRNALLKARADTVAETETANAVMGAREEEWRQVTEQRGLDPSAVIKTWRHRRGAARYYRPDHRAMSGASVRGLNTPFVLPDGTRMLHAHDPAGGARHNIRCGCDTEYRIDHTAGLS